MSNYQIHFPKSDEISRIWDPKHHPDLGKHFINKNEKKSGTNNKQQKIYF